MRAMVARVPDPALAWTRLHIEIAGALTDGDLQAAERWAIQAFEAITASGEPDAELMSGIEIANVRYLQGRYGELVEQIVQLARESPGVAGLRSGAALALIESGDGTVALGQPFRPDGQVLHADAPPHGLYKRIVSYSLV